MLFIVFLLFIPVKLLIAQEDTPLPIQSTEENMQRITGEAKSELASVQLGDTDVSLFISGYWKGQLQGSLGFSLTPLGTQIISPDSPVLFTQEADLTLDLWVRERWFVEATFLDDYAVNTYRTGYQGFPGEIVQYAGIGNTGLDFPSFPYLDLGGDSPSSFGYYGRFGGGALNIHTLFRWDQAAREQRIFVGDRERSFAFVSPYDTARGLSFVLPDTSIDSDIQVYLEDDEGTLRDTRGKRWRLAGPSEYSAGRSAGLVELSRSPKGMVAVAYSMGSDPQPWDTSMGSYGDPHALIPIPGSGFLGDVQNFFGDKFALINYPQSGGDSVTPPDKKPGSRIINGTPVLILYEPGTFSPFERRNRYEAPSSSSYDAALVKLSSTDRISGFDLIPFEASVLSADIPLYAQSETTRGFFELIIEGNRSDNRNPNTRWPLAQDFGEIYLPGLSRFPADLSLRFTNYGAAGLYSIGTDVVPGSVQVWRSGIQDSQFSYNSSAGTVNLTNPAGLNEVIRITYLKRSSDTRLGSIAAGLGAVYHKDKSPFSSELALGLRWNINSGDAYTEEGITSPGTVGLGAKTAWDFNRFKAQITLGLGFEQPDSTGLYRGEGMEGNEIVLSMSSDNSFISHPPASLIFPGLDTYNRTDLVYRNYRDSSTLGNTLMPIDWDGSRLISGENRPYPVRDPTLTRETQVIAAEFTLDSMKNWTGYEIPLADDASILSRAREIEIPFRFYDFNINNNFLDPKLEDFILVLEIGSLSGKDFGFIENSELILEKVLYDGDWISTPPPGQPVSNPAEFSYDARIARFVLDDPDRFKLGDAKFLRLMVVYTGTGSDTVQGRVLLAPPIVRGASFRPIVVDGNSVTEASDFASNGRVQTAEIRETGANTLKSSYSGTINRLHSSDSSQQVLSVTWEDMVFQGDSAGADGRIGLVPFSNYRALSFFVKGPQQTDGTAFNGGTLSFVIAKGPDFLQHSDQRYIEAEIPLSAFTPGRWSKVSIRYQGSDQGISVDDSGVSNSRFRYRAQSSNSEFDTPSGKSNYAAVFINPVARQITTAEMSGRMLPAGNFCIDEIILEDPAPLYRLNGGTRVEYNHPGAMVSAGKIPVLADLNLSTAVESEVRGDPFTSERDAEGGVTNRSYAGISLLGIKMNGNLAFTAAKDVFYWDAGHELSKTLGPFFIREFYSVSPNDENADHRLSAGISTMVRANADAQVYYDNAREERKWNLSMAFVPPVKQNDSESFSFIPSINVDTSAAWNTKEKELPGVNYGDIWVQSWRPMIPDLGESADGRETKSSIVISENTKPIGAILSFDGRTSFLKINNTTRSINRVHLDLPFILGGFSVNTLMERGYKRYLLYGGPDVLDDGRKFGEGISDSMPLWGVFPFYSLFTPSLHDAMDKGLENSPSADFAEYTSFNDLFGITAQFPPLYDIRSFFIPVNSALSLERILEQKLDTRTDILNLRSSMGFSSINMFGAFGYKPLFKFYQADEYSNVLDAVFAIPSEEDLSWRLQWTLGAGFRGFTGAELGFTNTVTFATSNWLESFRLDWTVPTKRSLLSIFYSWVSGVVQYRSSWLSLSLLMDTPFEQLRKESLEFTFDQGKEYYTWDLSLGHESIIRILGQLYFSVFAKLAFSQNEETRTMSFIGTIGTTLNIFY